jgi:hypothetical protein
MWRGKVVDDEEEEEDDNTVASNTSRRSILSKDESAAGSMTQVNDACVNVSSLEPNRSYSEASTVGDSHRPPSSPSHRRGPSYCLTEYGICSSPPRNGLVPLPQAGNDTQASNDCESKDENTSIIKHRERFYTGADNELDPKLYERSPGRFSPKRQTTFNRGEENFDISAHSLELLQEDASEDMWVPMNEIVKQHESGTCTPSEDVLDENQDMIQRELHVDNSYISSLVHCEFENGLSQATTDIKSTDKTYLQESLAIPPLPRRVVSHGTKQKDTLEKYRNISNMRIIQSQPDAVEVSYSSRPSLEQNSKSHEMVYFDTATNDASMKQLERIAPMPDREGYILGDQFLEDPRDTPLLVFVNTRSGSQQGPILKTQLRRLLNPIQIWDLADGGPEKILRSFSVFTRLRLLVCGGDGTVSWIISTLDKMKLDRWPPIAILPLGTGNDLARIHG